MDKVPADKKKLLVVIDPGHTGRDYNAGTVKGYYESEAVYKLSVFEKAALEARGIDVLLTRRMDEDPGLYERGQLAVRKGKGYENVIFESNHTNAFNGKASGVTVIRSAHLPGSQELGERIADAVADVMTPVTGVTYSRGVTTKIQSNGADWYGVIRGAVSGADSEKHAAKGLVQYAFIVEHGFHDNLRECRFLSKDANLQEIAEAKAAVIADYFGIDQKDGGYVPSEDDKQGITDKNNEQQDKTDTGTESGAPYLVRVTVEDLNIRKKPTVLSETRGFTGKGIFTIVEEAVGEADRNGRKSRWGRLKSGRGWICLDHAEKAA